MVAPTKFVKTACDKLGFIGEFEFFVCTPRKILRSQRSLEDDKRGFEASKGSALERLRSMALVLSSSNEAQAK